MANKTLDVMTEVWSEREKQKEKYSVEHDDSEGLQHLLDISSSYTGAAGKSMDPREALVKAAATLVAGIEWLDRQWGNETKR